MQQFLTVSEHRLSNCYRLLNDHGSLIWFGIHDYIGLIQAIAQKVGFYYRRLNIWHYSNGFSRSKKEPATTYEPFLWCSKSNKLWTYNADDVRVPYKSKERLKQPVYYKAKDGTKKAWQPNPKGALRGDVWSFPTLAGKRFASERTEHPTQKPEALITEILKAFCPKNNQGHYDGRVLDPFHGSGTLGACCTKLNAEGNKIDWLGIEIEERWCTIANNRLDGNGC